MIDFFQRRLESLERELTLERERSTSASALLHQQETLKSEVESHLKSLTEQLRREKAEKEGEEAKSHARGRVEALELRLDEMNATFASLLKEAVSRQSPAAAVVPVEALSAELTVLRRTIQGVADSVTRQSEDDRRLTEEIAQRFAEFTVKLQGTLSDLERRHDIAQRSQDERLSALADERTALSRMWEEQGRSVRAEFLKERIARETAVSDQIAELARRLDAVGRDQAAAAADSASVRETLGEVVRILTATPKAKDEIIVELEAEKADLVRSMRQRHEQLRATLEERREIEKTMGESLLRLAAELEDERARTREAGARADELKGEVTDLAARSTDHARSLSERDARALSLSAERDELTRALVAEAEKVRAQVAERAASDERWHQRNLELQRKVSEATDLTAVAAATSSDLRAQVATLSEHMARALQERDAVIARFADWERERSRLIDVLKQKDGMVAMLSSAFQGSLKKP